jgi:hypothetical protein
VDEYWRTMSHKTISKQQKIKVASEWIFEWLVFLEFS